MRGLIKAGFVTLVLSLSLAGPVAAGPFEDAMAAYDRGDYATALRFIRPLAEQGDTSAQYNLGVMYTKGQGVPQNYAEARKWYRMAADQGHPGAQSNLGVIYTMGHGIQQDYAEALKWYRMAADQGDAAAQNNLGIMYERGQSVLQDFVQAHKWFNLAVARFSASEREKREQAVRNRDRVAMKMTAAQIAEAQRLAREWQPK